MKLQGFFKKTLTFSLLLCTTISWAVATFNRPVSIRQPDGSKAECLGSGDEYGYRLFDRSNYTLTKAANGYVYYAVQGADGNLQPSSLRFGKGDPAQAGLKPGVVASPEAIQARLQKRWPLKFASAGSAAGKAPASGPAFAPLSQTGLNNVVVYIRLNDTKFNKNLTHYDTMLNKVDPDFKSTDQELGSLYDFYKKASSGICEIKSLHALTAQSGDINSLCFSYDQPLGKFCAYDAQTNPYGYKTQAEYDQTFVMTETMLKAACDWVNSKKLVASSVDLDKDQDGNVDSICFVVANEVDPNSASKKTYPNYDPKINWEDNLWPHSYVLQGSYATTLNSKKTYHYILQDESFNTDYGTDPLKADTFFHEMCHLLGAPDLYRYSYDGGEPIGSWDLMCGTTGQLMSAYIKWKYLAWLTANDVPTITKSGRYTLYPTYTKPAAPATNPSDATQGKRTLYKLTAKNNTNEYFLLEYRKKDTNSYDRLLPYADSGLVIHRIQLKDSSGKDMNDGNRNGPPDEDYLYRQGETSYNSKPSAKYIDKVPLAKGLSRTAFDNTTDPRCFLSNNADGGVKISEISDAGETITFLVTIDGSPMLEVSPTSLAYAAAGGSKDVTVTTTETTFAATASATWITATADVAGKKVTVLAAANTGAARTGTVTVKAGNATATVDVSQEAGQGTTLTVTPDAVTLAAAAGSSASVTVTTTEASFTATASAAWITASADVAGKKVTITAASANTAPAARTGAVVVTAGTASKTVTVTQTGSQSTTVSVELTSASADKNGAATFSAVTSGDSSKIQERGVCWGTAQNPTIAGTYAAAATAGIGAYQVTTTGLTKGQSYYARAYAKLTDGQVVYSTSKSFVVATSLIVETLAVNWVKGMVQADGRVIPGPGDMVRERGIRWSLWDGQADYGPVKTQMAPPGDSRKGGDFMVRLYGAKPGLTYRVWAYAKTQEKTYEDKNVKTIQIPSP